MKFTIAIEPGTKKTAYGVVVPDLPGCFSAGETVEEAFDNAREAIEAHCEVLAEQGEKIPATKPMSEWQASRQYRGWTPAAAINRLKVSELRPIAALGGSFTRALTERR